MESNNSPIYVTKAFLPPIQDFYNKMQGIWDNHLLTNQGPLHEEFSRKLCNYLKVQNITLFVNGHMALDVALKALKIKGEVITTPYTFASTIHAIVMNGLKPVFCDIKEDDYNIDEKKIEALITKDTSAILAVHVYGFPCNVEALEKIALKHNLTLIYDAAHAFGVEVNNKPVVEFGEVSMLSFHATKVFNSIEGGALIYNDRKLKEKFNLYKNFGIEGPEIVKEIGLNAKMNEFSAAMGICNLDYIDEEINNRKIRSDYYINCLKDIKGIKLTDLKKEVKYNYAYFPITIDKDEYGLDRDNLFDKLNKSNIFTRKYFYPLATDYDCYKNKFSSLDTPIAKDIANRILTLPIYGALKLEQVKYICEIIKDLSMK